MNAIEKSINRHQWKEVKRGIIEFKRINAESMASLDAINKYLTDNKAKEWRENLVNGFDFHTNQSAVKDMTSDESKEWAEKFFSAL